MQDYFAEQNLMDSISKKWHWICFIEKKQKCCLSRAHFSMGPTFILHENLYRKLLFHRICTCFMLAWRIKITLVRALWGGCCPLTLGVSHKQLLHSRTCPSTAGSFCSVCSHCFLCSSRAKATWESWLLYSSQLFHHAEAIIKFLKKKNMRRKVTWMAESSSLYIYIYQEIPFLPQMVFKHSYS